MKTRKARENAREGKEKTREALAGNVLLIGDTMRVRSSSPHLVDERAFTILTDVVVFGT